MFSTHSLTEFNQIAQLSWLEDIAGEHLQVIIIILISFNVLVCR